MLGHSPLSTDALSASGSSGGVSVSVALSAITNSIAVTATGGTSASVNITFASVTNSLTPSVSAAWNQSVAQGSVSTVTIVTDVNTASNTVVSNVGSAISTTAPVALVVLAGQASVALPVVGTNAIAQTATGELNTEGLVVDGYLSGATVARVNGSHTATVTTNSSGFFTGLTGTGSIQATGGTDVTSGAPFTGIFTAPDNGSYYTVVTPLTTLIDSLHSGGHVSTLSQSSTVIRGALGLPNLDLLTLNPMTGAYTGGQANGVDTLAVFKAGMMVSRTLQLASGGN